MARGFSAFAARALATLALSAAVHCVVRAADAAAPNPLDFSAAFICTADPDAATTVPGWTILAGSPALRCGGALHARWPQRCAARVLVGNGPYGPSTLERVIPLAPGTAADRRLALSGLFAAFGRGFGRPSLTARFLDGSGQPVGPAMVLRGAPAAAGSQPLRFTPVRLEGPIPQQAIELVLHLRLTGELRTAGSYVAAMRLRVTPSVPFAPPAPPPATVPRFAHVVLVMMENTDFDQLIGDERDAPFMNSLAARGTLLADYQAVYHPSDQNYLAIAGGDTFVRQGVYFPHIRLGARNLGDLLEAKGESWKAYLQGMGTPCNTGTRFDRYFEPDDAPFINFTDIRGDAARCRAHLLDLSQWRRDLAHADSTPAFAWLAADDYDDGEIPGNGSPRSLRVQDRWLRRTLEPLFASAAWRRQRTLLILTWDESSTIMNNHIATILVGSRHSVRTGYVSHRRYDHYSTARTIEAALGLPAMTSNDAYASPFNDAFARTGSRPTSAAAAARRSAGRSSERQASR